MNFPSFFSMNFNCFSSIFFFFLSHIIFIIDSISFIFFPILDVLCHTLHISCNIIFRISSGILLQCDPLFSFWASRDKFQIIHIISLFLCDSNNLFSFNLDSIILSGYIRNHSIILENLLLLGRIILIMVELIFNASAIDWIPSTPISLPNTISTSKYL